MRRSELEITDTEELEALLKAGSWGMVSLHSDEEWPYAVPMNYVYTNGIVALHSAPSGKRFELLGKNPRVQFTVVKEDSLIPSYALGGDIACPATQFFRSVMLWGEARFVSDLAEKADLLQAFMQRLQPEGGHRVISPTDEQYKAMLKHVCVIAIKHEKMTGKFKFGQNLSDENAGKLIRFLQGRALPGDAGTIKWMEKLR